LEREAVIRPLAEQLRLSQAISENAAERLQLSRMALRRRFASALRHRSLRRWPYSPWGPIHDPGIRFKYMELARVYDLSAVNQRHFRNFQI
jgi:hypothetical protein